MNKPFIRKYMLQKNNYCCEQCGFNIVNPYTNKSILQIHHLDGNYKNDCEENLQLLCPNCHALTDNYGARNVGKGRQQRKKYE